MISLKPMIRKVIKSSRTNIINLPKIGEEFLDVDSGSRISIELDEDKKGKKLTIRKFEEVN